MLCAAAGYNWGGGTTLSDLWISISKSVVAEGSDPTHKRTLITGAATATKEHLRGIKERRVVESHQQLLCVRSSDDEEQRGRDGGDGEEGRGRDGERRGEDEVLHREDEVVLAKTGRTIGYQRLRKIWLTWRFEIL